LLTVESAYGVAIADRDEFGDEERSLCGLAANDSDVAHRYFAQLEWRDHTEFRCFQAVSRGGLIRRAILQIVLGIQPGNAFAVRQCEIKLKRPNVAALHECNFGVGQVAPLDFDFDVVDEALVVALDQAQLNSALRGLIPVNDPLYLELGLVGFTLRGKALALPLDRLMKAKAAPGNTESPVTPR
jgi:hypothetical protein